jgi:Flp pilus assembly protein TadG
VSRRVGQEPRRTFRLRRLGPRTPRLRDDRGQATLEALALVPLFIAVGLGLLQLLAVGYASVLAGNAAEAGALALARGDDPRSEAQRALPGRSATSARIEVARGQVRVHLRPPSPLHALARRLEVTGAAAVEAP